MNERRVDRFLGRISEALESPDLGTYRELVERYEREQDVPAVEIAAALARLLQGESPLLMPTGHDPLKAAAQKEARFERERGERPPRSDRDAARGPYPRAERDGARGPYPPASYDRASSSPPRAASDSRNERFNERGPRTERPAAAERFERPARPATPDRAPPPPRIEQGPGAPAPADAHRQRLREPRPAFRARAPARR